MKPSEYDYEINVKQDKSLGYLYFIDKWHPLASNIGKVYLHRHQMSVYLDRWITTEEHVHHIDEDRTNNTADNLQIISQSDHARKHRLKEGDTLAHLQNCIFCDSTFITRHAVSCSDECSRKARSKLSLTKEELNDLVWKYPTTVIAEMYNVSDTAIGKRCKLLGVEKPSRGYWEKVYHKQLNIK